MQLMLNAVSFAYPGAIDPILNGITLAFPRGWTGVLGDNGCGKSTLARIAVGSLAPDTGSVTAGLVSVLCEQETEVPPDALADFALAWDRDARALRDALGIEDEMAWRYGELSSGERKKLQVAVALWTRPDVLVLDEPTNHLDARTRRELTAALAAYRGIGILISHDRELLDALAERCVSFEDGGVRVRAGGYSQARAAAVGEREAAVAERGRAKTELARLAAEQDRRAHEAARAGARRSKRRIDPADRDAIARVNLAIYTGQDGARGRLSAQMGSRVAAAEGRLAAARVSKRYDGELWLDARPTERPVVAHLAAGEIPCGEGALSFPELFVGNTDHVALTGPNGAGKSTLVAALRRGLDPDLAMIDLPQEIDASARDRVLAEVCALSDVERGRVLSTVAQLNSDPDRILAGKRVSPGELRKLMLAVGMLGNPALIIMDEPTNHLDLHSVEALERALASFPGALVLVSHDARFLDATTGIRWEIEGGAVRVRL
ncbi:MAG: ATP-binding cassette domain-containing protein [Collinsella sp.]|nr:ATP-binding cassette domain-containing protein [Collinsella sp.]